MYKYNRINNKYNNNIVKSVLYKYFNCIDYRENEWNLHVK